MDTIEYKGKQFPLRWLHDKKDERDYAVAQLILQEAISNKDGEIKRGCDSIDEQIWYYCDTDEWKMDEKQLLSYIKYLL